MSARRPSREAIWIGIVALTFFLFAIGEGAREELVSWLEEKGIPDLPPGGATATATSLTWPDGAKIEWTLFGKPEERRLTLAGWNIEFPPKPELARDPGCGLDCTARVVMSGAYCQGTLNSLYPFASVACAFHAWKLRDGRDVCFLSIDGALPTPHGLEGLDVAPPREIYFKDCPVISWH